jgi:hypothetical protein
MDGREHNNALNSLWNFISADYETRLARSGKLNDFIDGGMDYFLGPTGIPNKARAANTMMNPIAQMGQAGADATMATDPRYSRDERINAGVNALTGTLATLAPAGFMKAAGRPAADAVMETLVNTSRPLAVDGISDAARRFAVSEDGSFPAAPTGTNALRSVSNAGGDPLPAMRATDEYAGTHTAPQNDGYSSPLHELGGNIYPDDIYSSNAARYYGDGNPVLDRDTMKVLQSMRGKPDEPVSIYRAVPKGVTDINAGDWVTVNRDYAVSHGESNFGDAFDVIEQKVPARDLFTDGNSIHEFGYSPPTATLTPQQEMAERILEMRAAGNAADVTDEMMAMADDVTMFNRTPLPMDEASRMARAQEAGFDAGTPLYRGDDGDLSSFRTGTLARDGIGVTTSTSPNVSATYLTKDESAMFPVMSSAQNRLELDAGGRNWTGVPADASTNRGALNDIIDPEDYLDEDNLFDFRNGTAADWGDGTATEMAMSDTNSISRAAQSAGFDEVRFGNIVDRGGSGRWHTGPANDPHTTVMTADPRNIRSRFARFDPEFAHLGNLSAGVAGLGVVGLGATQGQQTDDPYAQRNTLAEVMRPAFGNALNGYTPPLPRNALQRGF